MIIQNPVLGFCAHPVGHFGLKSVWLRARRSIQLGPGSGFRGLGFRVPRLQAYGNVSLSQLWLRLQMRDGEAGPMTWFL